MKFEEKMAAIEKIVAELEKDEIKLEESINKYTEAMKLIKECDLELKDAEEKSEHLGKEVLDMIEKML